MDTIEKREERNEKKRRFMRLFVCYGGLFKKRAIQSAVPLQLLFAMVNTFYVTRFSL